MKFEIPPEIIIILLSMLPVWELRGSIPLAIHVYSFSPLEAAIFSIIGNAIAAIILLLLLDPVVNFLSKHFTPLKKVFDYFAERTRKKHSRKIEYLKELGLFVVVAIPLPATGAWTAALAAYIFGLKKTISFLIIFMGLIAAAFLVTGITVGFFNFI